MELREGRNEAHTDTLFVDQVSVLSSCMYSLLLLLLWYFVLRCSGARLVAGHYLYLGSGNTRTLIRLGMLSSRLQYVFTF